MKSAGNLRQRLTLIGVFAIFMLPILFALTLNLPGVSWRPFGVRNNGELLQPPPLLADLELRAVDGGSFAQSPLSGGWTLLMTASAPCGEACETALDTMHRVRMSLGEHGGRLRFVWLLNGDRTPASDSVVALQARHSALRVARLVTGDLPVELSALGPRATAYVVDPRGYLILRYGPGFDGQGLLKDLQRLLRYSNEP